MSKIEFRHLTYVKLEIEGLSKFDPMLEKTLKN